MSRRYFLTENIILIQQNCHSQHTGKLKCFLSFQAVRLVADLCLEYQVYDPQLWNSLLQKLLGFNLVRTIRLTISMTFKKLNSIKRKLNTFSDNFIFLLSCLFKNYLFIFFFPFFCVCVFFQDRWTVFRNKLTCMFLPIQIGHLQRVLEAVVAVPALWEVILQFIAFI